MREAVRKMRHRVNFFKKIEARLIFKNRVATAAALVNFVAISSVYLAARVIWEFLMTKFQ